jgi:hypothetical protein
MGRKKLNKSLEEIREQNRIRAKRFYDRHKEEVKKNRMRRYWKEKTNKV